MRRVPLRIPVFLVLASALGAPAALASAPRAATQVPEAMVSPVVVKHTHRTVRHKTVTRRTVHHRSTTHSRSTTATNTTK